MMITKTAVLTAARAEALFTSPLATGSKPAYGIAEQAIRARAPRWWRVELAVPRMRWARGVIEHLYNSRPAGTGHAGNGWSSSPDQRSR